MKPFGSSQKSTTNRKYGVGDLTTIEYGSQEAIVPDSTDVNTHDKGNEVITVQKEVTYTVETSPKKGEPWDTVNNRPLGGW
jgi:hypothetical protein